MTQPHEPKQLSPWSWPASWARDEAFWRDVASRTVSGILVVFISGLVGYVGLVAGGVLAGPINWVIIVVVGVILVLGGAVIAFAVIAVNAYLRRKSRAEKVMTTIATVAMFALLVYTMIHIFYIA